MDSYDLKCSHEPFGFRPIPDVPIEFEKILLKFGASAPTQGDKSLSQKYLVKLSSLRSEIIIDPKKATSYLESLYPLCIILSNDRSSYRTRGIPIFSWLACDGKRYESTCWRFELIMAGYAAALYHVNEACEKTLGTERLSAFNRAYIIFRHVCLEESTSWIRMNYIELPLECSTSGCRFFCSLCLCMMQRIALCKKSLSGWENWSSPMKLSLWLFEEAKLLSLFTRSRISDGSGVFLKSLDQHVIPVLSSESATLVLAYAARQLIDEATDSGSAKAWKLVEYAGRFSTYQKSSGGRRKCPRHEESAKKIAEFIKVILTECEVAMAANLGVGAALMELNASELREPNMVWALVPTKDPKYYKDTRKIARYTPDDQVLTSMFYNFRTNK